MINVPRSKKAQRVVDAILGSPENRPPKRRRPKRVEGSFMQQQPLIDLHLKQLDKIQIGS